jgi:hypothetical protein
MSVSKLIILKFIALDPEPIGSYYYCPENWYLINVWRGFDPISA